MPLTEWAQPCMELPDQFPGNVDWEWYASQALDVLRSVGITIGDRGHGGEIALLPPTNEYTAITNA